MNHFASATLKKQLYISPPPEKDVVLVDDHRTGRKPQLWFRWKGDRVRQEWCGQFPDGTPRAPWLDEQFWTLWENEGAEAARDKGQYDLSYLDQFEDHTTNTEKASQ